MLSLKNNGIVLKKQQKQHKQLKQHFGQKAELYTVRINYLYK